MSNLSNSLMISEPRVCAVHSLSRMVQPAGLVRDHLPVLSSGEATSGVLHSVLGLSL